MIEILGRKEKKPLVVATPLNDKLEEGFSTVPLNDTKQFKNEVKDEPTKPKKEKKGLFSKIPFISNLKKIKHIEVIIAVVLICIIALIYVSTFTSSNNSKENNAISYANQTAAEYAAMLENKLKNTLSQIKGAGTIAAMVTVESGSELIIAYSTDERTVTQIGSSGTGNTTVTVVKTPIVVSGSPIVLMEITPKVKGAIIVASGASDLRIRLDIQKAAANVLGISEKYVDVFVGK